MSKNTLTVKKELAQVEEKIEQLEQEKKETATFTAKSKYSSGFTGFFNKLKSKALHQKKHELEDKLTSENNSPGIRK